MTNTKGNRDWVKRSAQPLMLGGYSTAEAALSAGFFDQSHMTRQFTQTYGVSPGRWLKRLGLV